MENICAMSHHFANAKECWVTPFWLKFFLCVNREYFGDWESLHILCLIISFVIKLVFFSNFCEKARLPGIQCHWCGTRRIRDSKCFGSCSHSSLASFWDWFRRIAARSRGAAARWARTSSTRATASSAREGQASDRIRYSEPCFLHSRFQSPNRSCRFPRPTESQDESSLIAKIPISGNYSKTILKVKNVQQDVY